MARVKDTGPSTGSALIPAAGKQQDKKKITKSAKAKATGSSAKLAKSEVEPNATGHPIHSAATTSGQEADDIDSSKPKATRTKGKKTVAANKSEKTSGNGETEAIDLEPTKTALKKAAKGAAKTVEDAVVQIETTASSTKDTINTAVGKGKRKIAAVLDDAGESDSKKTKKAASQASKEKATKKEKTATKTSKAGDSGKKRKAIEDEDDTIKVDSSPVTSPNKKQKKSAKQSGSTIVDKASSLLDSVVDSVTGGQTSILEDVSASAKDAANPKPKSKRSAAKATKGGKSALEPTDAELEEGGVSLPVDPSEQDQELGEDEWEPEQEIAQLITGFESGSDDEDSGDEGFQQGNEVPKLPKQKILTAKERQSKSAGPGVIYVGRIPHGFHEHEMRSYFSQFGDVNHVRLSRSKKTGRSKHYAFLEFQSEEVAKIAAKTMDKYLLFGHILRCSFVPKEQVHPSLWKGADKRFKAVPWARIEGRKLTAPTGRTEWEKKIQKETKRRTGKAEKLKELGYEYEPTKLTATDSISVQPPKYVENGTVEEEKTVVVGKDGNSIVVSEEVKTKKPKKGKSAAKADEASEAAEAPPVPEDGKRVKKPSKRAIEASTDGNVPKKGRKTKST